MGTRCRKLELEARREHTVYRLQLRLLKCRNELDVVVDLVRVEKAS